MDFLCQLVIIVTSVGAEISLYKSSARFSMFNYYTRNFSAAAVAYCKYV